MLEVRGLQASYGVSRALFGVDLEVDTGGRYPDGSNGMGKTTTVNCIMGLLPVKAGSIRIHGQEMGLPSFASLKLVSVWCRRGARYSRILRCLRISGLPLRIASV